MNKKTVAIVTDQKRSPGAVVAGLTGIGLGTSLIWHADKSHKEFTGGRKELKVDWLDYASYVAAPTIIVLLSLYLVKLGFTKADDHK